MKSMEDLKQALHRLDGQDYGAYQSLKGVWAFAEFELHLDRIPKDPYAPPGTGIFRVRVTLAAANYPAEATASRIGAIALRDFLARQFHEQCEAINKGRRGTGHSGVIAISPPGQSVLERTSIVIDEQWVEARIFLGMPAKGRIIDEKTAAQMLFEELPPIVEAALFADRLDADALMTHIRVAEDSEFLRESLRSAGLVAFVADGAILPRASGVDDRPSAAATVVTFRSPESLRVAFDLPHAGRITGMGIREGVTLIVGGGYHGKSTLLQALQHGIHGHIPGDGREYCVCLANGTKVRAASGRSVTHTDISAFIGHIPLGESTTSFSTGNASGSTSQAAFIAEAVEAGSQVLLMDEDTCATNFMIRDERMQALVAKRHEPITAYVDSVKLLHRDLGVSTILVMGGSGDYFSVADCVIQMTEFEPLEVTQRAREIAQRLQTGRVREGGSHFQTPRMRACTGEGLDPHNEYGKLRISATDPQRLVFGRQNIDLSDVEQLPEAVQAHTIGMAIWYARKYMDGASGIRQIAERVLSDIRRGGLDVLDDRRTGNLAQFREQEFAAALNRFRGLAIVQHA